MSNQIINNLQFTYISYSLSLLKLNLQFLDFLLMILFVIEGLTKGVPINFLKGGGQLYHKIL